MAPLLLEALEERGDYDRIVASIVEIAARWERFELSNNEFAARAVKEKALEILKRIQLLEAEQAERKDAEKREQNRLHFLTRNRELGLLLEMFDSLAREDQNAQRRGYLLQDLLNRTLAAFEIPVHESFTRNEGAEQIDGAFEFDGWYYLTECRWRKRISDTREVDGLAGQISRSGSQTMGLFLSINGWSENVPGLLKQNGDKAIILMQGHDLRTILSEQIDLRDYISFALRNLNLKAEPYLSIWEYMAQAS